MFKRKFSETVNKYTDDPKKIVLLGDGCIGKSTFFHKLNNLNEDYRFPKKYKATDNFDFNRINLKTSHGLLSIDIWDTAGQENRGGKIRDAYLKGAEGVLLLYDISERKSIQNIPKWLTQIKKICPDVPVAVLGNKLDTLQNLQQSESVKLRDSKLEKDYGYSKIKNFIISIKEDTHLKYTSIFWSKPTITENTGCLIGLEYILNNIYGEQIKIEY